MLIFTNVVVVILIGIFSLWAISKIRLAEFLIACGVSVVTILVVSGLFIVGDKFLDMPFERLVFGVGIRSASFGAVEESVRAMLGVLLLYLLYDNKHVPKERLARIVFSVALIYTVFEKYPELGRLIFYSKVFIVTDSADAWKLPVFGFGLVVWVLAHFAAHLFLYSLSLNFALRRMWLFLGGVILYHSFFNIIMALKPITHSLLPPLYLNLGLKLILVFLLYLFIKKTKAGSVVGTDYHNNVLARDKPLR